MNKGNHTGGSVSPGRPLRLWTLPWPGILTHQIWAHVSGRLVRIRNVRAPVVNFLLATAGCSPPCPDVPGPACNPSWSRPTTTRSQYRSPAGSVCPATYTCFRCLAIRPPGLIMSGVAIMVSEMTRYPIVIPREPGRPAPDEAVNSTKRTRRCPDQSCLSHIT